MKSLLLIGCVAVCTNVATAQQPADTAVKITVNWTAGRNPMKTTPTLQVVVNPLLRRGAPIHDLGFEDAAGRHLLLINKRNRPVTTELPEDFDGGTMYTVDLTHSTAKPEQPHGRSQTLASFAVVVVDAKLQH